ncbi:hypothetical protein BpHYR1_027650 [Brachionus plicatilis]|uniref:Uncharacterized protein n=1 Tax=Brachionus plicatilis TaxID=10195 RepID=A0A3M7S395_BRAPC|nr:hypothetical protein BpHYR1_027650 [Brachionus plicatilis]
MPLLEQGNNLIAQDNKTNPKKTIHLLLVDIRTTGWQLNSNKSPAMDKRITDFILKLLNKIEDSKSTYANNTLLLCSIFALTFKFSSSIKFSFADI